MTSYSRRTSDIMPATQKKQWFVLCYIITLFLRCHDCGPGEWDEWCEDNVKVASYLTPFKFYGTDKRLSKNKAKMNLFKQFPQPPLYKPHRRISYACDKGVLPCIHEIKSIAVQSRAYKRSAKEFHPFTSEIEEFEYKLSASYYMCSLTANRKSVLKHIMAGENCLRNIQDSGLIQDFKRNSRYFPLQDARTDKVPFQCAEILYCPEICYSLGNHGLVPRGYRSGKDLTNPCRNLRVSECKWMVGGNRDIYSLMESKLNYSCNCQANQRGFEWSSQFEFCVDIDECFGKERCEQNQMCVNTRGGYTCTCKRGFKYNSERRLCEEDYALPSFSELAKSKIPKSTVSPYRLQLEILIGLRNSMMVFEPSVIANIVVVVFSYQAVIY